MQLLFYVLVVLSALFPSQLIAQARKSMTISELVTYTGKDREQVLYTGAKSEGKVTWYTSLAGDSYKGMIKAFETKYAGVTVEAYRTNGGDITQRMVEEAKARRQIVDTIETTEPNLMFQRDAFLLRPYHSPHFAAIPMTPSIKANAVYISGRPLENPISALPTTKIFCPRKRFRKTTKVCSTRRSKVEWGSPSTTPAPKSSLRFSRSKDRNW